MLFLKSNSICTYCNTDLQKVSIPEKNLEEEPKVEKDHVNEWIGPLDLKCKKCGNLTLYFSIIPPPSADQPPITKYKCLTCSDYYSQYKE